MGVSVRHLRWIATASATLMIATSLLSGQAMATGGPAVITPPGNAKWDYQIGGVYKPQAGVQVVSRDREAKPLAGAYNFCYVNTYQTQPQEIKWWKAHHNNLLLQKDGKYVVDGFWGEVLLDTSTAHKRQALAKIEDRWITGCKNDGFQAVEPDNLDSWTRSKGQLTKEENFAFAKLIIAHAHSVGLAIAQKNAAGQTEIGAKDGFDFAVAEECGRWRECNRYIKAYGDDVFVVEYRRKDFNFTCSKWGDQLSVVLRNLEVTKPGTPKYVYDSC
jgi:Glycoside-hydrolase family GH114